MKVILKQDIKGVAKKKNPEVKQCPQEKVEYIKDALRYFNEI